MASNAKFCSQCGNELPEPNPPFCSQCGTKINVVITATPPIETDSIISKPQRVSFRRAIELGIRGYVDFSGRSSRAEYWWWTLFFLLVGGSVMILDVIIYYLLGWAYDANDGPFSYFFAIAMFLPTVAVTCRRFHDINHTVLLAWILAGFEILFFLLSWLPDYFWSTNSGIFIALTVIVPCLFLFGVEIVWAVSKGHENANKYGPPVYSQTE